MDLSDAVCGVCFDIFVKPMILRCGHSFCELCAEESINFNDKCPLCRKKSVGICIYNRSLDDCIRTWIQQQDSEIQNSYEKRVLNNSRILFLKKKARLILWTVLSQSKSSNVELKEVERLYNEHQRSVQREEVQFDGDLREQIRREAVLHEGYCFMLQNDDSCRSKNIF
uniref:RING-type domain-containing protein n=1 Tax=Syphacia muris TaxID=451379 RepID=A0A0N5AJZ9_9BILA